MKQIKISLICSLLLFAAVSCDNNKNSSDSAQHIELSCQTIGFTNGDSQTVATWEEGDSFYLYRSEDWSAALLQLLSGAGSDSATFSGKAKSIKAEYYAVSPASAVGAVRSNGEIAITVAPKNILFAGENTTSAIPQVGVESDANQLTFAPIFGALQVELSDFAAVTYVKATLPNESYGLHGTFTYNLLQGNICGKEDSSYSLTRTFTSPIDISSNRNICVAMPEGEYSHIELFVRNSHTFEKMLYTVEGAEVKRGKLTIASATSTTIPAIVDSWHITSFEESAANVDIYIQFNTDNTFVIYQRNNTIEYIRFDGTYTIDYTTSTISGVYSDGLAWSESYTFQIENGVLTMVGTTSNEKSSYEVAEVPAIATQKGAKSLASRGVKRAL